MKIFMKIVVLSFLVTFFTQNCFADDYSFRKTTGGVSKAQVKSSESLTLSKEEEKNLYYKTNILGKDVMLVYAFVSNKLVSAYYILSESHTNKNDFINDYDKFKNTLTKKYGKAKEDRIIWKNDLYKDKYSDWGMALSVGHLIYMTSWETHDTEIRNLLHGENYDISSIISYRSKKLKGLEEKAKEKEDLDAL